MPSSAKARLLAIISGIAISLAAVQHGSAQQRPVQRPMVRPQGSPVAGQPVSRTPVPGVRQLSKPPGLSVPRRFLGTPQLPPTVAQVPALRQPTSLPVQNLPVQNLPAQNRARTALHQRIWQDDPSQSIRRAQALAAAFDGLALPTTVTASGQQDIAEEVQGDLLDDDGLLGDANDDLLGGDNLLDDVDLLDGDDLLGGGSPSDRGTDAGSESAELPLPAPKRAFDPLDILPPSILGGLKLRSGGTTPERIPPPNPLGGGSKGKKASKKPAKKKDDGLPSFFEPYGKDRPHAKDTLLTQVPYFESAFRADPIRHIPNNPHTEGGVYRGKHEVPLQRPLLEWGQPFYSGGLYKKPRTWLGKYNPIVPQFIIYGDFRTAVGVNRNVNTNNDNWASRLNLDMDLKITGTERIHAFTAPLDRAGDYTRLDFTNNTDFVNRTDLRLDNLFFEGDVGSIMGGLQGHDGSFDLPFAVGFMPFFYQNGVWAADNMIGASVALPARHSKLLKWSNYDATFFWASDQVTTDAFKGDNNAAELFGTAWFIEAYDGYIEVDYAFVHDDVGLHRSYHNFSAAFTRRYFHKISNSIRFIANFNQSLPSDQRTADGHLLLLENSLITASPNTLVPYCNMFYGQGRTQSLARAGGAGGILNNTGINFESDGLTGYPTLDATAVNTIGGAVGVNMLGKSFENQLILEFAALSARGSQQFRNARGDQYAIGARYQKPLNNAVIFRADTMFGFLRNDRDIRGHRIEFRWKF